MTTAGGGTIEVLDGLHLAWVQARDLPPGEAWLSIGEREILGRWTIPKRRMDWLLGRWAAKQAVASLLRRSLDGDGAAAVEIVAADDGSPRVRVRGRPPGTPWPRLSISHAGGVGFAVAGSGDASLGCDVEVVEARSDVFVSDYFTEREAVAVRSLAARDAAWSANLVWSAKESALKALAEGLRLDTRAVEVDVAGWTDVDGAPAGPPRADPRGRGWLPLGVDGPGGSRFSGSWRLRDGLVWTVLLGPCRP